MAALITLTPEVKNNAKDLSLKTNTKDMPSSRYLKAKDMASRTPTLDTALDQKNNCTTSYDT